VLPMNPERLWSPSKDRREKSHLHRFMQDASVAAGRDFVDYNDLHRWSIAKFPEFWRFLLDWSSILFEGQTEPAVVDPQMPGATFFPDVRLNFAENLLRFEDDRTALVSISESRPTRRLTYAELRREVARLQTRFVSLGVKPGDRIAGFVPNSSEAVIAMLAATSLGAIWSSCSPDFGVRGVLDRFGQIEPRFLIAANAYLYNGKRFDCLAKRSRRSRPGFRPSSALSYFHSSRTTIRYPPIWVRRQLHGRSFSPATRSPYDFAGCHSTTRST
jgi:acetoacetyl-CoA synthetase